MINIEGRLAEIKTLTLEKIGQRKPLLKSNRVRTTDNKLHEMINQYVWRRSALNIWPLNVRLAARIKAACKRKQQLVVACVLAVVCKRMQQLPTILGPAVHRGKDTTHKSL